MKHLNMLFVIAYALCLLTGCGAQPIPTTPPPKEAEATPDSNLMDEWHQLAQVDYATMDYDRAMIIANELALQGPNGLNPLFEVLENPDETPVAKMLAVVSLSAHITDSHIPRLLTLTDSKYDQATRGCATNLLGNSLSPESFSKVQELTQDPDNHVSKVAALVMLRKGFVDIMPKILELWDNPDTLARDRDEILLGMPPALAIANMRLFTAAVCNQQLSTAARSRAIQLLGDVAAADVLPDMKACLETETDTSLTNLISAAIALIEKRDEDGISAVPIQIPTGMDLVFQPKHEESADTAAATASDAEQE